MEFSFKKHLLSEDEKIWLQEVAESANFDPKIAKVKFLGRLSENFDHKKIDYRIYQNGKLTLVGLWLVNPKHPIFCAIDKVIHAIRQIIIENPGKEQFSSIEISPIVNIDVDLISRAFSEFRVLGNFYSSATGTGDGRCTEISLTSENAYDDYLKYKGIEELLENFYRIQNPSANTYNWTIVPYTKALSNVEELPEQSIKQKTIKFNTAFVLMAINHEKPELADVYSTIKRVCKEFDIAAYRADEIEHQERITDIILRELSICEFLIADLSFERPNVYYEVGYAHALNKKPILYRRKGTPLHFDLAVHNVPEYENVTQLEDLLRKRLEAILGRKSKVV